MSEITDAERYRWIKQNGWPEECRITLSDAMEAEIDVAILAERKPKDITPDERHIGAMVEAYSSLQQEWYGSPQILQAVRHYYGNEQYQINGVWFTKARLYMGEIPCPMRPYTGTVEGEGPWVVKDGVHGTAVYGNHRAEGWPHVTHYCPIKLIEV